MKIRTLRRRWWSASTRSSCARFEGASWTEFPVRWTAREGACGLGAGVLVRGQERAEEVEHERSC